MARIFTSEGGGGFALRALEASRYRVGRVGGDDAGDTQVTLTPDRGGRAARRGALLLRTSGAGAEALTTEPSWVLVAGAGSRLQLNGEPRALGTAVLRHRDEVRLDGAPPLYFSAEKLARVEAYSGDDEPNCPRCAQAIGAGDACVACPCCGVRHHEAPKRPCWTYAASCVLCDQPTELDAGLRWTPEEL